MKNVKKILVILATSILAVLMMGCSDMMTDPATSSRANNGNGNGNTGQKTWTMDVFVNGQRLSSDFDGSVKIGEVVTIEYVIVCLKGSSINQFSVWEGPDRHNLVQKFYSNNLSNGEKSYTHTVVIEAGKPGQLMIPVVEFWSRVNFAKPHPQQFLFYGAGGDTFYHINITVLPNEEPVVAIPMPDGFVYVGSNLRITNLVVLPMADGQYQVRIAHTNKPLNAHSQNDFNTSRNRINISYIAAGIYDVVVPAYTHNSGESQPHQTLSFELKDDFRCPVYGWMVPVVR
jgi:hypothetical protein